VLVLFELLQAQRQHAVIANGKESLFEVQRSGTHEQFLRLTAMSQPTVAPTLRNWTRKIQTPRVKGHARSVCPNPLAPSDWETSSGTARRRGT
jgi:ribosomal protein RSM22 (predicted rRNA methylase)